MNASDVSNPIVLRAPVVDANSRVVRPGPQPRSRASRGRPVAWHARRRPSTPALITTAGTITYGELNERANRLARALRRRGLRAGDAIALLCSNRAEFAEVLLATHRSGLRLTTVNWHL